MTEAGPLLFARYAYPPNSLGYCGPDDSRAMLEYASAGVSDGGLVQLARQFAGAWPYLALIAAAAGRPDPLDADVVEAYWIGNRLLERVPGRLLARHVEDRFRGQLGAAVDDVAALGMVGGRAHHNFHVFAVYPWVGMLRAGFTEEPLRVLESCRIRWGRVDSVHDGRAIISSRPLCWNGHALSLGAWRPEVVTIRETGYGLAGTPVPGDWVAAHWGWACQVLDTARRTSLERYTAAQLRVVNAGPASARPVAALLA
ncbi:MAG TPA: DUF6390 family protein [Micromonosporaceae bacterium]|jgi:hypothetical protein|nr:DUF6390 family protein [Micromonosporaceae bacterium]